MHRYCVTIRNRTERCVNTSRALKSVADACRGSAPDGAPPRRLNHLPSPYWGVHGNVPHLPPRHCSVARFPRDHHLMTIRQRQYSIDPQSRLEIPAISAECRCIWPSGKNAVLRSARPRDYQIAGSVPPVGQLSYIVALINNQFSRLRGFQQDLPRGHPGTTGQFSRTGLPIRNPRIIGPHAGLEQVPGHDAGHSAS